MRTAEEIFHAAMGLMDELDGQGAAVHQGTGEYARRCPGIVNMMIAEYRILEGTGSGFTPVEALEDPVLKIPDTYALGVMHYGLAANLLVDENPAAAGFFQERYEELRDSYFSRRPAGEEQVEDLYGGIEFGRFGRW